MTISSSLNAGVAGLAANASRLASISDNIANSSTYGYKRVETDFHSMLIDSGTAMYSAGGVRTTNQRLIDEQGPLLGTSNATDLAVRGRGMLPVTNATEVTVANGDTTMMFATTGSFRPDKDGYLVTETDLVLMGWPALPDGTIPTYPRDTQDGLEPVQINVNQFGGEATTQIGLALNLPATDTEPGNVGDPQQLSIEYFDNLGTSETLSIQFTPQDPVAVAPNTWVMEIRDSASGNALIGEYTLAFDDSRAEGGTLDSVTLGSVGGTYDPLTGNIQVQVDGGPIDLDIGFLGASDGLTQLSDAFAPTSITKDGSPIGNMTNIEVDGNGFVRAFFDSGIQRVIYQIPLVDMSNPNGLQSLDNQTYMTSPDSGSFFLWDAGDGPTGEIASYAREESTVDVAAELTALIQTQRAYSSNAKVIQTVDEMLQETTNIKR